MHVYGRNASQVFLPVPLSRGVTQDVGEGITITLAGSEAAWNHVRSQGTMRLDNQDIYYESAQLGRGKLMTLPRPTRPLSCASSGGALSVASAALIAAFALAATQPELAPLDALALAAAYVSYLIAYTQWIDDCYLQL